MRRHQNLLLATILLLLVALPLLLVKGSGGETGTDGQAVAFVATLAPDYEPWASPWMAPPSGEMESLLFALQAALGAGFIGYYLGLLRGRQNP